MPIRASIIESLERRTFLSVGSGFAETVVASGLRRPTAIALTPNRDSPVYITEQDGRVRIYRSSGLISAPAASLAVENTGDRGLVGIALDKAFSQHRYVYLNYTVARPEAHQRISRFLAAGDEILLSSEQVLLDLPSWGTSTTDIGGALHFGYDGTLYIGVGDGGNGPQAQSLDNPFGKILRINPDGTLPANNPFASGDGWQKYIWAYGLHDPSKFAVHPEDGIVFINDPGSTQVEEVNIGAPGTNYGWPDVEGATGGGGPEEPVYAYSHHPSDPSAVVGGHISGGVVFSPGSLTFPVPYGGDYFFADQAAGVIQVMDFDHLKPGAVTTFATALATPIDLASTGEGDLLCLARGGSAQDGRLLRYTPTGAPTIVSSPKGATVAPGASLTFAVTVGGVSPYQYQWQRDGTDVAGATASTYAATFGAGDDGASFAVRVSNRLGSTVSLPAVVHVGTGGSPDPVTPDPGTIDPGTTPPGGTTPVGTPPTGPSPVAGHKVVKPQGLLELLPVIVGTLPPSVIDGTRGRANIRIYSFGPDSLHSALRVRLFLSEDTTLDSTDTLITETNKALRIAVNASKTLKLKFNYPSVADGSYYLLAQIDPLNALEETDDTNNTAVSLSPINVAQAFIDIRSMVGPTATSFPTGERIVVPLTVYNDGNTLSVATLTMTLSVTTQGSAPVSTTLVTATVKLKLAPTRGKTLKLKFVLPGGLSPGIYTLIGAADVSNVVPESNEMNNTSTGLLPINIA